MIIICHKSDEYRLTFLVLNKNFSKMTLNLWNFFIILCFLILILWIFLYLYFTRNFNHWKNKSMPYIRPIPFFGNAIDTFTFRKNIGELFHDIYKKSTAPFGGFFIMDEPVLLIRDLELIKTILIKDFQYFDNRCLAENKKDDPLGSQILFLLRNPDWRLMRQKVSPTFSTGRMRNFYPIFERTGNTLTKYLEQMTDSTLETREVFANYATDTITGVTYGINPESFKNEHNEFRLVSNRVYNFNILERAIATSCYILSPTLVKLFRLKFLDTKTSKFLRDIFWHCVDERKKNPQEKSTPDLIDILIKLQNEQKEDDVYKLEGDKLAAQPANFFIGGFETTTTTVTFTLYELARNQNLQTKLRQEVLEGLQDASSFSYDTLNRMEFLDMCVKETLRKYPVLPYLDRRTNSSYKIPGTDHVLEKGIGVFISLFGLHYDPRYFPDPEKYDPERFSKENIEFIPPFSYLPFGDGPRYCIGARFGIFSSKNAIARIIARFQVDTCEKTQKHVKFDPKGFLLAPVGGLYLKFTDLSRK